MTKEELEKEAEEYLKKKNYTSGHIGYFASGYCKQAYIDSAEPREKQIAELTEQNTSLLTSVENLNKSVQELDAQIEKMKCCTNCKHSRTEYEHCRTDKHEKWEIKEK